MDDRPENGASRAESLGWAEEWGEMPRLPRTYEARRHTRCLALAATVAAFLAVAPAGALASAGTVSFERNATSAFAIPWLRDSNTQQRQWMHDSYARMRGYPPYHDQFLSWGPPADFYQDLYAIYRDVAADQTLMQQHPDWVLKDSQGRKLFIPWACDGGTCPAYAADIGNPAWRQHWIDAARALLAKGYSGIFIDNVNMDLMVGDGQGQLVRPIDPRTGAPMTDANWRRYVAEFTEQIKAAFPNALITHNAGQWWTSENDQYYRREVDAADRVELERGFNDTGLTGGTGTFSFSNYLSHVDWLHSHGADVVAEPYNLDAAKAQFELASFFLVSQGEDGISSDFRANPDNWWSGWDIDLGAPAGARYSDGGVLRRDFSKGAAFVNPPGASQRTINLPADSVWRNLAGNVVTSITLGAHEGAVLTKQAVPADPPPSDPPPSDPPPSDPPPSDPPPSDPPPSDPPPSDPPPVTDPPPATDPPPVTLKPAKHRIPQGHRVRLKGNAPAGTTVDVMARVDGAWQTTHEDVSAETGEFATFVRSGARRVRRFRAVAGEGLESRVVHVRVKRR